MVECPYCEHEFQQDDYYEMGVGTDLECPKCEKTIVILETDVQIVWTLGTSEEWDEDLARSKAAHEKALAYTLGVIAKSKETSPKEGGKLLIPCNFEDQQSDIGIAGRGTSFGNSINPGWGCGWSYGHVGGGGRGCGEDNHWMEGNGMMGSFCNTGSMRGTRDWGFEIDWDSRGRGW